MRKLRRAKSWHGGGGAAAAEGVEAAEAAEAAGAAEGVAADCVVSGRFAARQNFQVVRDKCIEPGSTPRGLFSYAAKNA